MFRVHVCDWSPALRIPLCIAMFTMPPGLWICPLDHAVSTFVILLEKFFIFWASPSSHPSIFATFTPSGPDSGLQRAGLQQVCLWFFILFLSVIIQVLLVLY